MIRFGDALARMHALAKASTLGLLLILLGAAVNLHDRQRRHVARCSPAVLHVLASPPASNMVSRATYLAGSVPRRLDVVDEGAGDLDAEGRPRGHARTSASERSRRLSHLGERQLARRRWGPGAARVCP